MKLKCPKCKRPLIVMCLLSYPPKYECGCNSCGFALRYFDREDNYQKITQEEVDNFYEEFRWRKETNGAECKN